jgi:GNAT superfamily N-acetyltransferase
VGVFTTRPAVSQDLDAILGVQKRAFGRVAAELGIPAANLPPLRETTQDLVDLLATGTRFFVAVDADDTIVGGVRGTCCGADVEIGRLVVDDEWLRRGVASSLMDALESSFPESPRFELFTGADARVALALYGARGYHECRRELVEGVELVWLEKMVPPALP